MNNEDNLAALRFAVWKSLDMNLEPELACKYKYDLEDFFAQIVITVEATYGEVLENNQYRMPEFEMFKKNKDRMENYYTERRKF